MRRREFLAASSVPMALQAGCVGDEESDPEEPERDRGVDDLDEETVEGAQLMVAELAEAFEIYHWGFYSDIFIPEYVTTEPPEAEIPTIGRAYASAVDEGFRVNTMPTGVDEDGFIEYMVIIEVDWAQSWVDGTWDEETYFERIEQTIH